MSNFIVNILIITNLFYALPNDNKLKNIQLILQSDVDQSKVVLLH